MSKRPAAAGVASAGVKSEEKRAKLINPSSAHSGVDAMSSIGVDCEMAELNEIEDVLLGGGESNGFRKADSEIDPELLKLLGDEPHGKEPEFGPEVDPQIAERWTDYLINGPPRDDKDEVARKYPIPKNIPHLKPPALNPELEILLQTNSKKEDRYKSNVQMNMGVALAALAGAIDTLLKSDLPADDMKKQVLPNVVDASKIICGAFRMMTTNRKYAVEVNLDRYLKQVVKECKPDAQYLCGPNLGLALNVKKLPNRNKNKNKAKPEAKPEANASATDVSMTDVSQTAEEGEGSVAETPVEGTVVDEDENATGNTDADLVKLLGDEPAKAQGAAMGPEVHTAIASRWEKFLTRGVDRKEMDQFNKKYLVPKNIPELRAPKLNQQLKSKLSDQSKREDRYIAMIQSGLGVGLSAIAETIDQVLRNEIAAGEVKTALLPRIVDAGKIMCGMFNALTTNRKYHIEFKLEKQYKYLVKESIPDEWLCGKDFGTKISLIESQFDTLKQFKKIDSGSGNLPKRPATGGSQKLGVKTTGTAAKVGGNPQIARKRWRSRAGPKPDWGSQGQGVKRKSSDWHHRPSNYNEWASRQPQPLMSARPAWNPWM
nr:unnamed protein product [Callosobruchus chinensis]